MTIDARGLLEGTTPDEWRPNSIAIVIGEDKNLAIFSPDMRVSSAISMARMVANARLIAAAPALARDNIAKDAIIEAQSATIERLETQYHELLYAVEKKHPNETRHETALRYITEREARSSDGQALATKDEAWPW